MSSYAFHHHQGGGCWLLLPPAAVAAPVSTLAAAAVAAAASRSLAFQRRMTDRLVAWHEDVTTSNATFSRNGNMEDNYYSVIISKFAHLPPVGKNKLLSNN